MAKSKLDWDAIDKRAKKRDKEDYIRNLYAESADRDYLAQKAYNEGRALSNDFASRTRYLQNTLYNELNNDADFVKSSYGSDTYNMLLQDAKKMRDAEYNKYYSDYMHTSDYINGTYDEKQKYLTDEYKDANKEKRNSFLKSTLSFLASISPTGDMSADIAQQQAEAFREQARQEMNKAKESKQEANTYDQYRADLYNEQYTKKNLEILNKNKELKNLVADLASKKSQQDMYTISSDDSLASYMFADKAMGAYQSAYNAISEKGYSDEEIKSLLDTYIREQNRISAEEQEEKNKAFADKHPVLASAGYVGANVFQTAAVPELLQQGISNAFNDEYKPIDTNAQEFAFTRFRNTTSQTVSENIEREMKEKTNSEFWEHAASFAYQTGLSIGDFATVAVLPEPVSLAIMGTTAGVSAVKDATDRGISADKALLTGLAAGVSEIFFEKFSLENFNALKTSNKSGVKEFVKDIMKQSFTEGSEEVFTDISNAITDQLINSDKSELNQQYNALLKKYDGDKDKAWSALCKHFGLQLAESFAGGALSGAVMGSGAKGINTVNISRLGKNIQSGKSEYGSLTAVIQTANNIQDDAINKPLKRVISNENPTIADIGRLYMQVENSVDKKFESAESLGELIDIYDSVSHGVDGAMLESITAKFNSYSQQLQNNQEKTKSETMSIADNSDSADEEIQNGFQKKERADDLKTETEIDEAKTNFNFENTKGSALFNLPASSTKNGNRVEITSVADNTGEAVWFNTNDGKKVSLDEVDFPDNDVKQVVLDAVNTYQTAGASAFIKNAPDVSLTSKAYIDYNNNAQVYYNLGASGVAWSTVSDNPKLEFTLRKLGEKTAKEFFDAGYEDIYADTRIKSNKTQKTNPVKTQRTQGKFTNKTDNAQLDEVFSKLADKLHIDITYQKGSKNSNGSFVASKGQATINEGAKRGDMTTVMHECVGEYMRAYSPTEYKQLSDSLITWLAAEQPELTQKDIINYYNTYLRSEPLTTMQDARFEMTNDLLGALFASEDGLTDFCQWLETDKNTTVKQKKTILEQLKELIQKAVERLKEYFNKEKFTGTQKAVSEMELKQAQQFRQQCLDILDHAISNLENGVEISNGTKNSTDPSKRIAKNRKSRYDEFNTLAMQWAYSNKTNVGDTKVFNKNGKNYVLIEATEDGYIEIASGNYEKVRADYENSYNKANNGVYGNIKRIRSEKRRNIRNNAFDKNRRNDDRDNGQNRNEISPNNITRNNEYLRTGDQKPSAKVKYSLDIDSEGNKLSEQQQEYFKNSKVRDENGNLQVVYHGTTNEFTVFDRQFGNSEGDWGKGFYFTTEYDDVEQNYANKEGPDLKIKIERYAERLEMEDEYADLDYDERLEIAKQKYITSEPNIIEAYLNITNPVNVGSNETYFDYEESYDEEYDEYSEPEGLLVDFVEALNSNLDKFEYWGDIDFWSALGDDVYNGGMNISDIVENLNNNLLDEIIDDEGNIAIKELIRMSLEDMGFDGIIDTTVSDKFSAMNGLYDTTTHYIVFNSNQAKNTDNQTPTSNEDIRYSIDIDEFDAEDYTYPKLAKKEYSHLKSEILTNYPRKKNVVSGIRLISTNSIYRYILDDDYNVTVLSKTKIKNIHNRKDVENVDRNGNDISFKYEVSKNGHKSDIRHSGFVGNGKTSRKNDKFTETNLSETRKSDRRRSEQNGNYDNLSEKKRYSIDIDEYDTRSLIKQNKQLQKSVEYYKMMLGYNSGHKVNRNKIRSYAVELKKQWNTALSTDDIADSLTEIFDFISSGNATWDSIESMGNALGKEIVYNIKQETDPENQAVLDDLKQYTVSIDSHQRDEITYYYGGVRPWLNVVRRGVKYSVSDRAVPLDSVWLELSNKYPYLFDADTNANDQPIRLYEVIEQLNDTVDNMYGYDENELAQMIMLDIYDRYFEMPEVVTPLERMRKKLVHERIENRNRLEEVKRKDREKYAQRIKQVKQHYIEMNARLREKKNKATIDKLAKQRAKFEGKEKRIKETHEKAALRASIRKQLNKILTLASNPTKKKHIPNAIVDKVQELAQAVTLDGTQYDEKLADKLFKFRSGFAQDKNNSHYSIISEMYNNYVSDKIDDLTNRFGNMPLKELSVEALREINELITMTVQSVNNINRLFNKERNATIEKYAGNVTDELTVLRKKKLYDGRINSLFFNSMKPEYFFDYLGSDTLKALYNDLRKGEDVWAVDVSDAKKYAVDIRKKYKYSQWDFQTKTKFNTKDGEVELNLEEMLAVYANLTGEHTKKNLLGGGFVFDKEKSNGIKKKRNDNSSHRLSADDVNSIVSQLTDEQKSYVRDMISYLSSVMGEKGNEVTRQLYDVELFKEKNYYPALVNKQTVHNSSKEVKADRKIKNAGFTNATIPEAKNPIVLKAFDDVWASHVDEMSKYHAFVLPMENLDRVYNFYNVSPDNQYSSTKEAISNAHGEKAIAYIDDLLKDINGGVVREAGTDIVSSLVSKFKKNAVFASASVVVQQPSAIGRALSEIDLKYFAKTTGSGFNRKSYNEMKKYAPVAVIKEMGYFDTNMAQSTIDYLNAKDYDTVKDKLKAFVTDGSYRDEAMSFFASKADEITWTHIWNACKNEIKDKHKGLSDNEICELAAEKFTDVIVKTQVYDSVFSRSGLMRSNDNLVKNAMAFMAEPTTSLNMFANAAIQVKRGKMSKSRGARVLASLVTASVINALLQSLVTAARADGDDDDWKEVYLAQLIPNFIDNLNPINQIGFVKDIVNVFKGYDISRSDMNLFVDLYTAIQNLYKDSVPLNKKVTGLAGALGAFLGVPIKNITRDIQSVVNIIKDFNDDKAYSDSHTLELFKEEMNNSLGFDLFTIDKDKRFEKLCKFKKDGNQKAYDKVYKELQELGLDDKAIQRGMKSTLVETDIRVANSAIAYANGDMDTYIDYIDDIIKDGFDEKVVDGAVDSFYSAMKKARDYFDEGEEDEYNKKLTQLMNSGVDKSEIENALKLIEDEEPSSDTAKQLYSWDAIYKALDSQDYDAYNHMYKNALETKIENGYTKAEAEEKLRQKLKSHYKNEYINNNAKRSEIETSLKETGLFNDDDFKDWIADSYDTESMLKAFNGGVNSTRKYVSERIKAKVAAGSDADKAEQGIKQAIAREYKEKFINGNADTKAEIITIMTNTGLYGNRNDVMKYLQKHWKN